MVTSPSPSGNLRVWVRTELVVAAAAPQSALSRRRRRPGVTTEPTPRSDSARIMTRSHSCEMAPRVPEVAPLRRHRSEDWGEELGRSHGLSKTPPLSEEPHSPKPNTSWSVPSHKRTYEWTQGWMTRQDHGELSVCVQDPGGNDDIVTLSLSSDQLGSDVLVTQQPSSHYPDDLVTLQHFHEPTVVECLQHRYQKGCIYTATGPVLIACNPFQSLPDLYGDALMALYWTKAEQSSSEALPPHTYAIADGAFRSMMRGIQMSLGPSLDQQPPPRHTYSPRFDQSILVSGESGAGKTVTTKHLMQYLAALSQRATLAASRRSAPRAYQRARPTQPSATTGNNYTSILTHGSTMEAQVLQSNPILESFGNARTIRNDNSSRFGKFIDMQFTRTGRLVGTKIETYLLEKVRLVSQMPGERNYHIFYELLSADMGAEEFQRLHIHAKARPSDFKLLSGGVMDRRDGVSDGATYRDLVKALHVMGFSNEEQDNVMRTVAAILHAANLTFLETGDGEGSSLDWSNHHVAPACSLFGVTPERLNESLCFASINALGKTIRKTQNIERARKGLDALLKSVYGALFEFVVDRVNETISCKVNAETDPASRPVASIGVLDIFGFESFQVNSFEQLCINYCNEALQQQFNTFMLKNEQAEYISEGVDWSFIQFPENQDVLDLIERKPEGIMVILDDMCRAPNASDAAFSQQVYQVHSGNNERFKTSKLDTQFGIQHFAGLVEYNASNLVEKNRDDLPPETSALLIGSTDPFVHKLAEIILPSWINSEKAPKVSVRPTVGGYFRQQVKDLRKKIDSTSPHYVRCIKPNEELVPNKFDVPMVAHQLRCGGIIQAVTVTRCGFTLHYSHLDFIKRYGLILNQRAPQGPAPLKGLGEQCKSLVTELLELVELDEAKRMKDQPAEDEDHQLNEDQTGTLITLGKSKVLLKHRAFESLERRLSELQNAAATTLNARFRGFLCRLAFRSVLATFLAELSENGYTFERWFEENRALYYQKRNRNSLTIPNIVQLRKQMFLNSTSVSFDKEAPTQSSRSIHLRNPVWILVDGLWARNPNYLA